MLIRTLRPLLLVFALLVAGIAQAGEQVDWKASLLKGEPKPGASVTLALEAQLQPGWHLYSLTQKGDGPLPTTIDVSPPLILQGKPTQQRPHRKMDPNFGIEVEYFEDSARFEVPVKLGPEGLKGALKVRFQLCNETSCLPPETIEVPVAAAEKEPETAEWTAKLATGTAKPGATVQVALTARLGKGWHLYSMKPVKDGPIATTVEAMAPLKLAGKVIQPKAIRKHDPNFGVDVEYFEKSAVFRVPVQLGPQGLKGSLKVRYQLCNDTSCLPPTTVEVPLGQPARDAAATNAAGTSTTPPVDQVAQDISNARQGGLLTFIAYSFGLGLLSLLTPCVFPMIPITVSYFSKQRQREGSGIGLAQPLAYCLGIIGSFTAFGVIVTLLFGASGIQTFATNPYINLGLAVLFIVLALNLFGVYHLTLPASFTNRFSGHGKAGLAAPLLMGFAFTLTSFTCTVPFVGTLLVSATSGDVLYPLIGMLSFSTAFALPFFLLALFPQFLARLPKSGAWLETTKAFMGFVELAAAVKFFSNADLVWGTNLLTRPIFLAIWVVLAVAAALFLLGRFRLPTVSLPKQLGTGRVAVAVLTLVGAGWLTWGAMGRHLGEVEAFLPPEPQKGTWIEDYEKALARSRQLNRPMLVNFTGVTCTNCRWMEKNMFPRESVKKELNRYVLTELYTDRDDAESRRYQALQRQLTGVVTLPVYVIVTPDLKVVRTFQGSTREEDKFVSWLQGNSGEQLSARR